MVLTTRDKSRCVQFCAHCWEIEGGPVLRTGAASAIRSTYVRDPDLNLIEIAEPA